MGIAAEAQNNAKKHSRVRRNADGTISELERTNDKMITKRSLKEIPNGERIVISRTIYLMDLQGRPRSSKIFDGVGKELFKIRYGYSKVTGLLVAEDMFDSQVNKVDDQGRTIPVQRLYYKYDPQGRRSKPFAFTFTKGKRVEEGVFAGHIKDRMDKQKILDEKSGNTIDRELQEFYNESKDK